MWEANDGQEEGTEGDSFFVAFREAPMAIAAAVAGQRALAAEPWPDDAPIRVRMGINSGGAERIVEADGTGGNLVGVAINRAARLGGRGPRWSDPGDGPDPGPADRRRPGRRHAARHRGASAPGPGFEPVRIFQVVADGLPVEFPPIRTLDARPNNLPTQLTTFIGRDAELDEAAGLLASTRLLTLTGPGGTGKTRLSLQLAARTAEDFPDGVFFVALEPVREPMLVAPRIAAAVGVVEGSVRPIAELLADWLRDKRLLLVLDNFEQVVAAAPIVADLLRAAPDIKVIVTSRAVLHISGEQEYPVPGLPTPPDPSQLSSLDRMSLRRRGARRRSRSRSASTPRSACSSSGPSRSSPGSP